MKIAYSSFSQVAQKEELPYGCQGIRYTLKKVCNELGYDFGSYFKEPDILLFEVPNMTSMVISHNACAKACSMIKTSKRIILVGDDSNTKQNFRTLSNNKIPFTLKGDNGKLIKEVLEFQDRILKKEFDIILPVYDESFKDEEYFSKRIINFDYSHLHDYVNVYKPEEKRILSYSFKDSKTIKNCEIISGRELYCFSRLCRNRICYMTDYGKNVPKSWVRNRYAQCYYANALMVGLKESYFGKDFNIRVDDLDNFEEKVYNQRKVFEKMTSSKEHSIDKIKKLFNE